MTVYTVRCIKGLEHRFDDTSGWCIRCGRIRGDGRRVGVRVERLDAHDITEPRHPKEAS